MKDEKVKGRHFNSIFSQNLVSVPNLTLDVGCSATYKILHEEFKRTVESLDGENQQSWKDMRKSNQKKYLTLDTGCSVTCKILHEEFSFLQLVPFLGLIREGNMLRSL